MPAAGLPGWRAEGSPAEGPSAEGHSAEGHSAEGHWAEALPPVGGVRGGDQRPPGTPGPGPVKDDGYIFPLPVFGLPPADLVRILEEVAVAAAHPLVDTSPPVPPLTPFLGPSLGPSSAAGGGPGDALGSEYWAALEGRVTRALGLYM
jgi:hypothetical protein